MVQKRHLAEEQYDVSSKHLKLDDSCQSVSCLEFPLEALLPDPYTSGKAESCLTKQTIGSDFEFEGGKVADLPVCTKKDLEYALAGSSSSSSWTSSTMSDEDVRSDEPILALEHSPAKPRRVLVHPGDMYSYLLRCPPLKEVPVGPEFQADIPDLCSDSTEESTCRRTSEASTLSCVDDDSKFIGFCVIPMPKVDATSFHRDDVVGCGRGDCCCENPGSINCVRRHISEARESLKREIGHELFSELGFDDMGEVVAENWSQEEEQLFDEIVYSNPASLRKNFWDHLAAVFPSRPSQEIVSYYFNVFVLRRRAEQNRCDRMNIDSDDDEWQVSDDEGSCPDEIDEYDSHEHHRNDNENPNFGFHEDVSFLHGLKGSMDCAGTQSRKLHDSCFDSTSQPSEKILVDGCGDDLDLQDDSCTSSDTGVPTRVCEVKADDGKSWGNHEFILEQSDSKVWDVGYFSCPRHKADFLPTGSMIEEVFGVESWNLEVADDDKASS